MHKKFALAMLAVYSMLWLGFVIFYPAYEIMHKQTVEHIFLIRSLCFAGNLIACCFYLKGKRFLAVVITIGIGIYLFLSLYNKNFIASFWDSLVFTSIFLMSSFRNRVRHTLQSVPNDRCASRKPLANGLLSLGLELHFGAERIKPYHLDQPE